MVVVVVAAAGYSSPERIQKKIIRSGTMKLNRVLMLLLLAFLFVGSGFTAFGATINPRSYWLLEDGYSAPFSMGKTLTVTKIFGANRSKVDLLGTGTWMQRVDNSGNLLMYGSTMSDGGAFDVVNSQNAILFPAEMVVGETHRVSWLRNEYDSDGASHGQGRDSVAVTVNGPETVTVPAGTYTTYRFLVVDTWTDSWEQSGTSSSTFWLAKGVGWVKVIRNGQTYELQEHQGGPPLKPRFSASTTGVTTSLSWSSQANTQGYTLFYAPYPGVESIGSIDMGAETGGSFTLWEGAAFYLAVQAYNSFGSSELSNIAHFVISGGDSWANGLYVIDASDKEVIKFDLDGNNAQIVIPAGMLTSPRDISIDKSGNMLIAEDNIGVKVFEPGNTTPSRTFGPEKPRTMTVGNDGTIYVGSLTTGSIYKYDSSYNHIGTLDFSDVLGGPAGNYEGPTGMAIDPATEHLIFSTHWASSGTDRGLIEIELDGTIVNYFGPGWYSFESVTFGTHGHLYTWDNTYSGTTGSYGLRVYNSGRTQIDVLFGDQYHSLCAIGFDTSGKLYFSDYYGGGIGVYTLDANLAPTLINTIQNSNLSNPGRIFIKQ